MASDRQVFWAVLPERGILERPFVHFMQIAEHCGKLGYHYIPLHRMRTDIARDQLCAEFKRLTQNPDDVLIQLDADHNHPTDIVEQLVADDKPVVAALAFRSNPTQPDPCFWILDENGIMRTPRTWEKGLVRASVVGTGAVAIKRSVFTQLDAAGFDLMYFFYQYPDSGLRVSEEVAFNQMCYKLGIEVYVDTRLVIPHCADGQIDESSWEEWCANHPIVKREHKVSVIIPQRGRFDKLRTCLESLIETAPEAQVVLMCDTDEGGVEDGVQYHIPYSNQIQTVFNVRLTPIEKWNAGATYADGNILMLASNDVIFQEGWYEQALDAFASLPDEEGVVGTNDLHTDGRVSSPHYLASRKWLVEHYGGVLACPLYQFSFIDVDICYKAKSMGQYVWAMASHVSHEHPQTNSAPIDEIHKQGYAAGSFDADQKLFLEREKIGFPVTWQGELK